MTKTAVYSFFWLAWLSRSKMPEAIKTPKITKTIPIIVVKKMSSFKSTTPPVTDNKGVKAQNAAVCATPISCTAIEYKTNAKIAMSTP